MDTSNLSNIISYSLFSQKLRKKQILTFIYCCMYSKKYNINLLPLELINIICKNIIRNSWIETKNILNKTKKI